MSIFRRFFNNNDDDDNGQEKSPQADKQQQAPSPQPPDPTPDPHTIQSGSLTLTHHATLEHTSTMSSAVSFSPDNQYVATRASGYLTYIWNTESRQLVSRLTRMGNGHFGLHNDRLVVRTMDGEIQVVDIHNQAVLLTIESPTREADKPNEKYLFSGMPYYSQVDDRLIVIWQTQLATENQRLFVRNLPPYIDVYSASTGERLHRFDGLANNATSTKAVSTYFSPDHSLIATTYDGGSDIRILNVQTGETMLTIPYQSRTILRGFGKQLTFSGDNRYLGFQPDTTYQLVDLQTGEQRQIYESTSTTDSLFAFSTTNNIYLYDKPQQRVIDAVNEHIITDTLDDFQQEKYNLAISYQGNYIANVNQQELIVRHLKTGDQVTYTDDALNSNNLSFSSNGDWLVVHPLMKEKNSRLFRVRDTV